MAAKRRTKGGGRKPRGDIHGKSKTLSTRITPETRQALETEALARGQSISQVAEQIINLGLQVRRERDRGKASPARALGHIVAELSEVICGFKGEDGKPAFDWLTNPFMFQALRMAIPKFMDTIAPTGDVRSPAEYEPALANSTIWGPHDTPEARANYAVMVLSHNLRHAQPVSAEKALGFDMPLQMKIDIERTLYSMHQAREALIPKGG
jgi:hypothetical protein